jgi:predicted nuclease of predicted toxin-antitoxin system
MAREQRIVITADKDFGTLIFLRGSSHAGVIRLPQVPVPQRIALLSTLFERHSLDEITGTIVTVRASGIRISRRDW